MNLELSAQIYADGTFWEITQRRVLDWYMANGPANFIMILFMILPFMMIGAGAAKLKWLEKAKRHKILWTVIFFVFLLLGLVGKILPLAFGRTIGKSIYPGYDWWSITKYCIYCSYRSFDVQSVYR